MAITETPFIFTPSGEQIVKREQPAWIDKIIDFATGLVHGLQSDKAVDDTVVTTMVQQQNAIEEQRMNNLLIYGGLVLAAVFIISKR